MSLKINQAKRQKYKSTVSVHPPPQPGTPWVSVLGVHPSISKDRDSQELPLPAHGAAGSRDWPWERALVASQAGSEKPSPLSPQSHGDQKVPGWPHSSHLFWLFAFTAAPAPLERLNSPGQLGRTRLFSRCSRTWHSSPSTSTPFVALGRRKAAQGTQLSPSRLWDMSGHKPSLAADAEPPCAPGMLPPCRDLMWPGAQGHVPRRALCPSGSRWRGDTTESKLGSLGKPPACIPWGRAEEFSLIIIRIKAKGAQLTRAPCS